MRDGPRKPTCFGCPDDLHYNDAIPKKGKGVMMHLGERFCTNGKKARRFKRGDPKTKVPSWCPKRKIPCELRVYVFKSVEEWCLYTALVRDIGRQLSPHGHHYALVKELCADLPPREFWKRLDCEPYQSILGFDLEPYSVLEIDDGLQPVFFFYVDGGFKLVPSFDANAAQKNRKEECP